MEENRRTEIEQRIGELRIHLSSNTSEIGDWKVAKCAEAFISGTEMPYDFEQLKADRQAVRNEINALQIELASIPIEDTFKPWTEEDEREAHPENFEIDSNTNSLDEDSSNTQD